MTKFLKSLATSILFAVIATAGHAAILTIDENDQLTGATSVSFGGGVFYDVNFEEGSCAAVFSGCDAVDDFDFDTVTEASDAVDALAAALRAPKLATLVSNSLRELRFFIHQKLINSRSGIWIEIWNLDAGCIKKISL